MSNQANQPAFAAVAMSPDGSYYQEGLTKRELIAAMALQGFVQKNITLFDDTNVHELRAKWAVDQADALLAELEKDQTV